MREYIKKDITIDGRNLPYKIYTAKGYLETVGYSNKQIEQFEDGDIEEIITEIIALKHSSFLLRNTSHSCNKLPDSLIWLKNYLISKLKHEYEFDFDESIVEV